ncbi:MAG: carbohydrate-binding domain-containing protein, partial [Eubacterium sp.]|nr:carbohydrate-binding domain-containing protein [Eubacterium sp.]
MRKKVSMILVSLMMVSAFAACGNIDSSKDSSMNEVSAESTEDELEEAFSKKSSSDTNEEDNDSKSLETAESSDDAINEDSDKESSEGDKDSSNSLLTTANVTSDGMIDATDMFTDRDLEQTADLTSAEKYILSDGEDITITSEGVYIISGQASEVTIYVEAGDEDKVQIVLDSATISNESRPAIYVKSADKVFV